MIPEFPIPDEVGLFFSRMGPKPLHSTYSAKWLPASLSPHPKLSDAAHSLKQDSDDASSTKSDLTEIAQRPRLRRSFRKLITRKLQHSASLPAQLSTNHIDGPQAFNAVRLLARISTHFLQKA